MRILIPRSEYYAYTVLLFHFLVFCSTCYVCVSLFYSCIARQNYEEARAQIEGTVRMQVMGGNDAPVITSGIS